MKTEEVSRKNKSSSAPREVDEIVAEIGRSADCVIPILQAIQREYRHLPEAVLRRVCEITDITPTAIYGVATFFPQFRFRPAGEHTISVCDGTACHLKGALEVYDAIHQRLHLKAGEDTDKDGLFTLQKVRCLGCCTLAPAVQIDGITFGHVNPDGVGKMLDDFLARASESPKGAQGKAKNAPTDGAEIRIGLGSCCVAGGSEQIRVALDEAVTKLGVDARVKRVSCVGMCCQTPMLEIVTPGAAPRVYAKVRPDDVEAILQANFPPRGIAKAKASAARWLDRFYSSDGCGNVAEKKLDPNSESMVSFLSAQRRIATEYCGEVDPTDLDEYMRGGGFDALRKCLRGVVEPSLTPEGVIGEIGRSGLRGRGGAGFPTARKWRETRIAEGDEKFVICNGDEGDPGAFMDRMILESYPFRVLEGMSIASVAVGANRGICYIRAEYPLAVERMRAAIKKCREAGVLGDRVMGGEHAFDVEVREGAGAFVCGEESALIASLEGRRPTPRHRPPYPARNGLFGKPTLVNNVETLSLVPWIIRHGADAFASFGASGSKGTKVFALAGKIRRGGLIEVPMGMTIQRIVEEVGGGVESGRAFKAVQVGGPSGGCAPASLAHLSVDYEALAEIGSMMGSGGFVVLDDRDCMVDMCRYFLSFTQLESCGKCVPCRVGTKQMLEILTRLCEGKGAKDDLDALLSLANTVKRHSLCGLGRTAPNPVLTSLRYFRDEFEAHLVGLCPARKCKALIKYSITDDCIGCTKCAQHCPSGAIQMTPYAVHEIDPVKCVKCGGCFSICPVGAVKVE
jgi:NADH:ubiquinone oxidoreductase subunit F (NADH-binding)/NADH:ubiquinone oxidoreductase subunit E/NAD-dependent dihydropyrimidine dehydrogenase PreA subunit